MAKQGEIEYLQKIGEHGIQHAVNKPFSDPGCGAYLSDLGAILALLPPVPARLLDLGCGTGWTSVFFAKRGYDVVGVDISPDMIFHANGNKERDDLTNLQFMVSDYESMRFQNEFDCVVFFDALHHAVDEEEAIRQAYRALKPGGVCITVEPGRGHSRMPVSKSAMEKYGVTEKDMPPRWIIKMGKRAGFKKFTVFPHPTHVLRVTYSIPIEGWLARLARRLMVMRKFVTLAAMAWLLHSLKNHGMVCLVK
jgi:SAM-dependent methyltransferase